MNKLKINRTLVTFGMLSVVEGEVVRLTACFSHAFFDRSQLVLASSYKAGQQ